MPVSTNTSTSVYEPSSTVTVCGSVVGGVDAASIVTS